MGTLYNCLREVRLEKYYPAFRANGITRYESLANLTMAELCAMGISGAEDRRRLVELVNIIKSVSRSENNSNSGGGQGGSSGAAARKRQPGSPTPSSARSTFSAAGSSQSEKKVARRRPRSPPDGAVSSSSQPHGMRLEPTRDVSVRERGPNFSVGSYLDMLEFMSDSSHSDTGDHLAESSDGETARPQSRPQPPPPTLSARNPPRKLASSERVRSQARSKGYNYGVPSSRDSARSSRGRGGGGGGRVARDERIRVCVRKRPLSRRESRAADPDIIEAASTTTVTVKEPKVAVDLTAFMMKHEFVFDEVFDESCSNDDVYIRAARPLITTVFQRSNATFFAYGQTGAGKTHTMIGSNGVPGLYQLAAQDVFDIMASGQHGTDLHVWVSFFEIYCGQLFDLLNRRSRLVAREDGSQRVCIAGLTETEAPDVPTLIKILQFGNSVRSRGTSGVNPDSSRSHAVLQMEIRHADEAILGKISFIDLAGSERASDMGDPDRQTRMEGAEINQSLLALKECIRSIDQESRHTPFRQSKLTHILKDAFVGNSRTCMIANVSPVQSACEHTLNTLRYADRVKELRRDSSQATGSASFGQAMNLLMNIPITAPSIFHPSNVLSTSTPVRPRPQDHPPPLPSSPTPADITLDPSETPIRGHNVFPKSAAKLRARPASENLSAPARQRPSATGSRSMSGGAAASAAAAASQGVLPSHPEASPSESDHTDTDSNNVTHPTETRALPSVPNIPVIGSTDTEFDFPTSDFNNIDDQLNDLSHGRNDLNQLNTKAKTPTRSEGKGQGQAVGDQAAAASASGPRSEPAKPQGAERRVGNPPPSNQLSGRSVGKTQSSQGLRQHPPSSSSSSSSSSSPVPKQNKNLPLTQEKVPASRGVVSSSVSGAMSARTAQSEHSGASTSPVHLRHPPPSAESFDDALLFGGPEGDTSPPRGETQGPSGSGGGGMGNKHGIRALPGPQTALSSDLTSFSQRSPLKNDLEKMTTPSPRDLPEGGLSRHVAPSPRYEEGSSSSARGGGGGKEPSSGRNNFSSSPSSHRAEAEPGSGRLSRRRMERATDNQLPFAAYSMSDPPSPRQPPSSSSTTLGRNSAQASWVPEVLDSSPITTNITTSSILRTTPSQTLSGPSSDPVPSNLSPDSVHSAKDSDPSSSSLPSTHSHAFHTNTPDSHHRHLPSDTTTTTTTVTAKPVSSITSSALVTEKLMSGAVFSPIHPQPVSTTGGAGAPALKGLTLISSNSSSSASILHPTPVGGVPSVSSASNVVSASSSSALSAVGGGGGAPFSVAERDQARIGLVGCHEDQLASITSLCKQEMKLLLNAKKAVPRSFDDYLGRVSSILAQKMSAIQQLQESIRLYQSRFFVSPRPTSAPVPVSAAGASSNDAVGFSHT